MIRISNIHLPLDYTSETVLNKAAKLINVDKKFFKSCTIFRRSIDARKKDNIFFLATVDAELFVNEEKICKKFKNAEIAEKYEYNVEKFRAGFSPESVLSSCSVPFSGVWISSDSVSSFVGFSVFCVTSPTDSSTLFVSTVTVSVSGKTISLSSAPTGNSQVVGTCKCREQSQECDQCKIQEIHSLKTDKLFFFPDPVIIPDPLIRTSFSF